MCVRFVFFGGLGFFSCGGVGGAGCFCLVVFFPFHLLQHSESYRQHCKLSFHCVDTCISCLGLHCQWVLAL